MSVCDEKFFVRINIYHSDERDSSICKRFINTPIHYKWEPHEGL